MFYDIARLRVLMRTSFSAVELTSKNLQPFYHFFFFFFHFFFIIRRFFSYDKGHIHQGDAA